VRRINEVAAPKTVKVYQWTGDCDPTEEAVAMTERLGLMNINGSDPGRWQNYASLALRPATIWNGGYLQFNGRSMSENHFTDLWTRNFFAFQNAICTYERTGSPRRITPIHLYFHYYVVEQPSGEMALRNIIEWIRKQKIYPMAVSEYEHWFRGFLSGRIESQGGRSWRIRNYGHCRTVRFDDTREAVDFSRSLNLLGYCREGSTLYVHLGKGDEAVIALHEGSDSGTYYILDASGDWDDGWIRAKTAADADFMTPSGPLHLSSKTHDLKVDLR
jgi:hypothetical protein